MLRFGKRKVILDKMKTFLIYIIFLLTMLGTSTASGNFSKEGKTCVYFHICSLRGPAQKSLFCQTSFAFALKVIKLMRQLFIQKCVSDFLICLGLNLSGCREIFSSWRQPELKLNCYIYLDDFVSLVTCF